MKRFGATPEEWAALTRLARRDLLPVVSNPHAEISPLSRMKAKGKTPSQYNHNRQVAGFPEWTDFEATARNIEAWSQEPDNGICIQTRRIKALDIDVPDVALADEIACRFAELIEDEGEPMALRYREDSGKRLLAFVCAEPLTKRSFVVKEWKDEDGKTKRWIVELLADGQQFIAAGTHPEGARYEWAGGVPAELPAYSLSRLDRAWRALVRDFALPDSERQVARRDPTLAEDLDVADPVAEFLIASDWPTYAIEKGMLYLECPNAAGHSSDNGETQTAWLLAGSGKYRKGHFRCMHAGCGAINDDAFFKAVGYSHAKAEDFEDLTLEDDKLAAVYEALGGKLPAKPMAKEPPRLTAHKLPLPGFIRDGNGMILLCLENLITALRAPQAAECEIAFDEFRGELMLAEQPGEWRPLTDADAVRLRMRLEALGFKERIGREIMRDALEVVGDDHRMDTAQEWLLNVVPEWDGIPRIRRFWPDYINTKDTAYTQALGDYSWTAQAGRILSPGCQVDMVPVMVSPEGYAKTSVIAALAPDRAFFSEFNLGDDDDKLARKMRGTLVGELAELRGVSQRDGEAILAWITRREEKWTPKYKEYAVGLARRLVFYGTTNDDDFLQVHMGKRRWLPATVLRIIDLAKIEADRLQLWAEARDLWLYDGVQWREVERLAVDERDEFQHTDPWQRKVEAWLKDDQELDDGLSPRASGTLRSEEVLTQCLGIGADRIKKAEQQRIGAVLKAAGMVRVQRRIDGQNIKVWIDAELDTVVGYAPVRKLRQAMREG